MKYDLVNTVPLLRAWVDECIHVGICAIDTETTGFDWENDVIVSFQLAVQRHDGVRACYIPCNHTDEAACGVTQLGVREVLRILKPLLMSKTTRKVFQNALFDLMFMRSYGAEVVNVDDTMMMAYILDGATKPLNMGDLADRYLGRPTVAFREVVIEDDLLTIPDFSHVRLDHAVRYAAEDAEITLELYHELLGRMEPEDLTIYDEIDRPLIPVLLDMKWAGVRVDASVLEALGKDWTAAAAKKRVEIEATIPEWVDIGSNDSLSSYIFGTLGVRPPKVSKKTGKASVDEDSLEKLSGDVEFVGELLAWRKLSKLVSTYAEPIPRKVSSNTGRLHASINPCVTVTARFSGSDPNLQNIPVRTEEGQQIRRAFIAESGHKLVSADYSNIEVRILAQLSKEKALIEAFVAGLDMHAMTMRDVWGYDYDEVVRIVKDKKHARHVEFAARRTKAKNVLFGIIYGITEVGLSKQLKVPAHEAHEVIEKFFESRPAVWAYTERMKKMAREKRQVETLYGRVLPLGRAAGMHGMERQASNYPIQGSSADMMRRAMGLCQKYLIAEDLPGTIILTVHDELLVEAPDKWAPEVRGVLKRAMEDAAVWPGVEWVVPIVAEPQIADSWGAAH